jgi:antitoxin (DNA-binding transcriptional repressor) of toxin-antitoxin stability system
MKTVSARELKAHWARIERQVKAGGTFEVLNRGTLAAHIVPDRPRQVRSWPDHLATAGKNTGRRGSDIVLDHRGPR